MSKRNNKSDDTSNGATGSASKLPPAPAFGVEPEAASGPAPTGSASDRTGQDGPTGTGEEAGRKRGPYKKRPQTGQVVLETTGLSFTLRMLHDAIANATGQPILSLREEEADQLAKAVGGVMSAYSVVLTEKQQALSALVMASGAIYGPRLYVIMAARPQAVQTASPPMGARPSPQHAAPGMQ